ncbi:MAG: response regulator [Candidatus Saccharimonadales bacterium]
MSAPSNTKRILLVEDDADLHEAFGMVLGSAGYIVDSAYDGKQALELAGETTYDMILLDLLMPVMDGKTFLKKFDNAHKTPIIVFSNLDAKSDIDEAIELGATRYMLKAWASPRELLKLVTDTL